MPLLVGTASWTDPTLIACGTFYPPEVRTPEARLRFYATRFPLVEVSSSYYALPSAANADRWVARTPPHFSFDVKAHRLFTGHTATAEALPPDLRAVVADALGTADDQPFVYGELPHAVRDELWHRFRTALQPLRAAGKLGAVLFQFAPWVRAGAAGEALVEHCVDRMAGGLAAVEFRHRSWFADGQGARTLALLRALGAAHVVVDGPVGAFENCVPAVWSTTCAALATVRLHGRNAAAWNGRAGGASSGRFRYQYSDGELEAMVPALRRLEAEVERVHVVVNTNYRDQGQTNARRLLDLL